MGSYYRGGTSFYFNFFNKLSDFEYKILLILPFVNKIHTQYPEKWV